MIAERTIPERMSAADYLELVAPPEPKQRRRNKQEEHQEQVWYFARVQTECRAAELQKRTTPYDLIFAIPNGTAASATVGKYMVAEGVRSGVPDIMIAVTRIDPSGRWWPGFFIEMKKPKGGVVSDTQKRWLANLTAEGYRTAVCNSGRLALELTREYLSLPSPHLNSPL